MPEIIKTLNYTGTVQSTVIPAGAASVTVKLWGGGGGGGGSDSSGPGRPGAGGQYLESTIDLTGNVGNTLTIGVGGGGGGGSSGGGAAGGTNGKSLTGYSGGRGGNSGPAPFSGAGGGGGGATVVLLNGTLVAVAGGGGGGAGDGQHSTGTPGIATNSATSNTPGTLGENGADHSGDGAGGGGGGGGADGGRGGSGGSGDNGGTGGYSGSSGTSGTLIVTSPASGRTPAGSPPSGIANGASASSSGANGLAILVFTIGTDTYTKVGGTWKKIKAKVDSDGGSGIRFKKDGVWHNIKEVYAKIGGTWKAVFNAGIDFISNASGFGDNVGTASSGTPGSGGGCFLAGTLITMADGSTKPVEQVDLRDEVAVGGYVFATGKFLIDNLYDYKGIKVSGEHMVKENGNWMRVKDSSYAVSMGDDEHIVYVFGTEYRRIVINGIEFTDYFEISEKEELYNHGDKFFGIWQEHDRQIHDENVKILNDGN